MLSMQQQINQLSASNMGSVTGRQISSSTATAGHCLSSAYNNMAPATASCSTVSVNPPSQTSMPDVWKRNLTADGLPPDMLPHIDVVSQSLRKSIVEGKDVNLSTLLIPGYDNESPDGRTDRRLCDPLTLAEFIMAYGKYKRIMCDHFPRRQKELDLYEGNLIRISNLYGQQAFNDYHKMFSAKSAETIRMANTKLDWSFLDQELYAVVTAGRKAKTCDLCGSVTHGTNQCPKSRYQRREEGSGQKEPCRNFNGQGCTWKSCRYSHRCSQCKSGKHGATECPLLADSRQKTGKHI